MLPDRRREIELLLLTMFAAVPLYGTQTVSAPPLIIFHLAMAAIALRVAMGKGPELIPAPIMRALGMAYVFFYIIDAAVISRSAIAASTHLVLFIAAYQPIESMERRNDAQRLLTATLIFTASLATATHIAIVPFVVVFAFFLLRQLIHISHLDSLQAATTKPVVEPPSGRAAAFYVAGTTVIGVLLFPMLPRVRNPLVPGMTGPSNAATGLSDAINFNEQRSISPDAAVVSRIWMGQESIPFFTPLRLRGTIYERFYKNEWLQARREFTPLENRDGATRIARPAGFTRRATIQQHFIVGSRLFLPAGTYEVIGPAIFEGPTRDLYSVWNRRDILSYDVSLARSIAPLRIPRPAITNYPVIPEVRALAQRIVGSETNPMKQASAIERYLSTTFTYIPNPAQIGRVMSVDQFLLSERRGHCEYFAAGMVALLTALNVPSHIVGGFYGGQLNPLTGYFIIRRADAHAWVEVWNGDRWTTFDPTPANLRPGNATGGLQAYASALGDSVNYFWDRYILTFGLVDQVALAAEVITRLRATLRSLNQTARHGATVAVSGRAAAAAAFAAAFTMALLWILRRRRDAFDMLRDHLRNIGIEVGPAMTMEEALRQLRRRHPDAAIALQPLISLYQEERFSPRPNAEARRMIRRRLQELRA